MRKSNPELEKEIRTKTLELLQEKEPYEIGMRDIATQCGVTATSIYLYYKDKEDLFRKISLDSLSILSEYMQKRIDKAKSPKTKISEALKAFRDWCFDNPKTALLFMGKISVDTNADKETLESYYTCIRTGQKLLEDCIEKNIFKSKNPKLDTNIIVYGLWGCIQSILLERSDIEFWNKSIKYTDRFIEMALTALES
ncbi:MAG: TetR/AcrR family transcriptional regulator [Treponema sp.]|nr:TetR/AcrR family transcriptional regulator [Treponema sp.]